MNTDHPNQGLRYPEREDKPLDRLPETLTPEQAETLRAERNEAFLLMEKYEDAARHAPGFWGGFAARASIAQRAAEHERDQMEKRARAFQQGSDNLQKERDALAEKLARIELAWDECGGYPTTNAERERLHELIVESAPHVDETLARLRREAAEAVEHWKQRQQAASDEVHPAPPDDVIPELPAHQQFVCSEGCGVCVPELFDFVYSETRDSLGHVFEQLTHKAVRSQCCHSEVEVWDDVRQDTVPWPVPEDPA